MPSPCSGANTKISMTNNMASNVSSRSVCSRRNRRNSLMALTFILGVAMDCQRLLSAMPLNILLLSHRVVPERPAPIVRHAKCQKVDIAQSDCHSLQAQDDQVPMRCNRRQAGITDSELPPTIAIGTSGHAGI